MEVREAESVWVTVLLEVGVVVVDMVAEGVRVTAWDGVQVVVVVADGGRGPALRNASQAQPACCGDKWLSSAGVCM